MTSKKSIVLITTATRPPEGVYVLAMTNVSTRKITAKAAVLYWASLGVNQIVIADATGQTLLDSSEIILLSEIGVEIEQINYQQNNHMVIKRGKGYGEGALIKFALQRSELLSKASHFFKCTGKVYCRNFSDIFNLIQRNNLQNIFWKEVFENVIDTRFFYTSKNFADNYLLPAYENINDRNNLMSEHCILKVASENLNQVTAIRPLLSGFSGSLNKPYFDASLGFLDNNLPCWVS
ncbi:MAG: hypothetical protein EBT39_03500 [Sphingobacteriia bacterium]|nr:hypothetical protein [Candidatus Fonsibacter lacus]